MRTEAPRILICRLSAIGDCIQTMPVLCALRERFPRAFIAWAAQQHCAPLLEGHSCLDRLVVLPRSSWAVAREVWALRATLREMQLDVAIDPQSLTKSSFVARSSGAPRRIGFTRPQGRELAPWLNNELVRPSAAHVVDRYLELLRPLGIEAPAVRFQVPEQAAATASAQSFLRASNADAFAVLNPGAGWDSRRWPPVRFAEVAKHLGERHGLRCVVTWAGERERDWARSIAAAAAGHALLAPQTNLPELAALLREARLFVGSDTGPLHLAVAVGTRCVGLYGPTRPERSGAYGSGHVAVQQFHQTGANPRRAGNAAMQAIRVDSVCRACDEALG